MKALLENNIKFEILTKTEIWSNAVPNTEVDFKRFLNHADDIFKDYEEFCEVNSLKPLEFSSWKRYNRLTNWREFLLRD